jgi:hypothetical protein
MAQVTLRTLRLDGVLAHDPDADADAFLDTAGFFAPLLRAHAPAADRPLDEVSWVDVSLSLCGCVLGREAGEIALNAPAKGG